MADEEGGEKKSKAKARKGAKDEFEAIKIICIENRGISHRVLDRIRTIKSQKGATAFDAAKKTAAKKSANKQSSDD